MALTLKADGLNPENLFTSSWVNDFTNLLTGAMNDQNVILNYRAGSGNGKPTLGLRGDGNNPLLKGYKPDDTTQAFMVDSNGNLTLAGAATSGGFSLARMRAKGATAGVNIWIATAGNDPVAADGLVDGDVVLTF